MLRLFLLVPVLIAGSTAMIVEAQNPPGYTVPADATLLALSVQAEISHVPDVASLSVGVVTEAADGNAALRQNAERMAKVVAAVRNAGIGERDIRTSGVHLSPQYQYRDREAPRIIGYQANNTVTIKAREIARLGELMDALAGQGANQIHGPNFEIDQPEPVYDDARRAAVAKAKARAQTYAEALGLTVRRLVSINEGGGDGIRPMPMMAMAKMADAMETTPIAPGENTVSVTLEVLFELGR